MLELGGSDPLTVAWAREHHLPEDQWTIPLDLAPTVLILTPVLMTLVKEAGIDPYYFGIMFMMNNAIGLITPPVGTVLNVVSGVARVNLDSVIKGMWPFLIAETLVMFLLVLFPDLVIVPARWFY